MRLVQRVSPSVVALRMVRPGGADGVVVHEQGSGSILDTAGHVLTNAHVVRWGARGEATFGDGLSAPFEVVARFADEDLAIVRLEAERPLRPLALGRSHDLMLGEPALVIGAPGGLLGSISTGVISGIGRTAATDQGFLVDAVQITAEVNGGNSGGPLINALGEQIGVVTSKQGGADGIAFAIAADRVRALLPGALAPEARRGFWLGVEVDPLAPEARVVAVAEGSPAAAAGVRSGDVLRRVGALPVTDGAVFQLALLELLPGGEVELELDRGGAALVLAARLAPWPVDEPASPGDLVAGLSYAVHDGVWDRLPELGGSAPSEEGSLERVRVPPSRLGTDAFAVALRGYVRVPSDGFYRFWIGSDDGSRLRIGSRIALDNDGLHAHAEAWVQGRLRAGLHPVEVKMFEAFGDESLSLHWEGPGFGREEVPAAAFLRHP